MMNLLEKLGLRPEAEGHLIGCPCSTCFDARQTKLEELLAPDGVARSFWMGVLNERANVLRWRDQATLAWVSERGWSNSLRAEHGRQQRGFDAYEQAASKFFREDYLNRIILPLPFWQGVLCERYIMLAEGRLSAADKRRMGLRWFTSEENVAQMMIDLMHSQGRIGPNGIAWMTEQLHQRGEADKNYVYDLQRARDILRAACNLMDATP